MVIFVTVTDKLLHVIYLIEYLYLYNKTILVIVVFTQSYLEVPGYHSFNYTLILINIKLSKKLMQ